MEGLDKNKHFHLFAFMSVTKIVLCHIHLVQMSYNFISDDVANKLECLFWQGFSGLSTIRESTWENCERNKHFSLFTSSSASKLKK